MFLNDIVYNTANLNMIFIIVAFFVGREETSVLILYRDPVHSNPLHSHIFSKNFANPIGFAGGAWISVNPDGRLCVDESATCKK